MPAAAPAVPASQSSPAAPSRLVAPTERPTPPRATSRVLRHSSALFPVCSPAYWQRRVTALLQTDAPKRVARPTVAELLLRAQAPLPQDAACPARPVILRTRQNPMHPETASPVTEPPRAKAPDRHQHPTHREAADASAEAATTTAPIRVPPRPSTLIGAEPAPGANRDAAASHPPAPASTAPHKTHHTQNPMHREPARTGPLRNGNPRGNPNAAPRCGARTRAGCPCKAPAIKGKLRCRMHGGRSTGPRSAEGLERLRAARTTHGRYAAPSRVGYRFRLMFLRRSRVHLQARKLEAYLPAPAAARLRAMPLELAMPPYPPRDQPPPSRARERDMIRQEATALAPWKCAIALARMQRQALPIPDDDARQFARLFAALPPLPRPLPQPLPRPPHRAMPPRMTPHPQHRRPA